MLGMLSVNESGSTATAFRLVARGLGRSSPARLKRPLNGQRLPLPLPENSARSRGELPGWHST
jgi:hypothetical protein